MPFGDPVADVINGVAGGAGARMNSDSLCVLTRGIPPGDVTSEIASKAEPGVIEASAGGSPPSVRPTSAVNTGPRVKSAPSLLMPTRYSPSGSRYLQPTTNSFPSQRMLEAV